VSHQALAKRFRWIVLSRPFPHPSYFSACLYLSFLARLLDSLYNRNHRESALMFVRAAADRGFGVQPAMSRVCSLSLHAILCSFLVFAAAEAFAQSSIDDVHIAVRTKPVEMASAFVSDSSSLIRARVELVMVPVTITDDYNRPVIGLQQDNFRLFEGKKPQEIKNFSSEDAPLSIGLIVDTSGSMSYKLDRARDAVAQFCDTANPRDEFFLITFADTPRLVTDFTTSTENIENDLLTTQSKGQTSLLDAVYMGLKKMHSAHYARRALLIISDGGDNHSLYTERDVKRAVKESDVMLYAVGTYDRSVPTEEEMLGPELMQEISEQTGGRAFSLSNPNEMPAVTRAIGSQLRHQYMLAYQPPVASHDGKWHKINVKLLLPKHLNFLFHVQARPGYYAENISTESTIDRSR
jgi:Ca-activated chloride channel homolog